MNTNKEFNAHVVTPEEQERLDEIAKAYCHECGTSLTLGEAECGGICTNCYFNSVIVL